MEELTIISVIGSIVPFIICVSFIGWVIGKDKRDKQKYEYEKKLREQEYSYEEKLREQEMKEWEKGLDTRSDISRLKSKISDLTSALKEETEKAENLDTRFNTLWDKYMIILEADEGMEQSKKESHGV